MAWLFTVRYGRNEVCSPIPDRLLVNLNQARVTDLVKKSKKSTNYVSNMLAKLLKLKLVTFKKQGNEVYQLREYGVCL